MMDDEILTVKELAAYLRIVEKTAYRFAAEGKLPGFRVGGMAIPQKRNRSMDERAIDQRRRCRPLGQHGSGEQIMSTYWVIGGWDRHCDAAGRLQRAG